MAAASQDAFGFIDLFADEDGVVRSQKLVFPAREGTVYSFALQVAARGLRTNIHQRDGRLYFGEQPLPDDQGETLRINYRAGPGFINSVPFHQVLERHRAGDLAFLRRHFHDRMVLIGTDDIQDRHLAPIALQPGRSRTPGVEIHAQAVRTLAQRDYLHSMSDRAVLAISALLIASVAFLAFARGPVAGLSLSAVALLLVLAAGTLALQRNIYLRLMPALFGVPLCYATVFTYRFTIEDKRRRRIQRIFGQYVPNVVVQRIAESVREEGLLEGVRHRITVLFSDIRSFTTLTEQREPEDLVLQLNEYFGEMTEVVLEHGGIVDKFIGDGILALFGAPIPLARDSEAAVGAAVAMLESLKRLNEKWAARGWPALQIGIGINTGEAIVGSIGSRRKREFTALGDTVNVASRI
ncbi:MAG: adenylate/guanylate cyclase domain-containing protein, partial [Gammaproteobacteria bacterium]